MPVHDWSTVDAGIFHQFHHFWIDEVARALNQGVLPGGYYALAEQHTWHFGPDVLTLQSRHREDRARDTLEPISDGSGGTDVGVTVAKPKARLAGETDLEFYRRKQNVVAVRHVSGDRLVAVVEIVSPGNKSSQAVFRKFVDKAVELLSQDIHLLILDLIPPTRRDPNGIHGAIWEALTDEEYKAPPGKPLTLAAYEAEMGVRPSSNRCRSATPCWRCPSSSKRAGTFPSLSNRLINPPGRPFHSAGDRSSRAEPEPTCRTLMKGRGSSRADDEVWPGGRLAPLSMDPPRQPDGHDLFGDGTVRRRSGRAASAPRSAAASPLAGHGIPGDPGQVSGGREDDAQRCEVLPAEFHERLPFRFLSSSRPDT